MAHRARRASFRNARGFAARAPARRRSRRHRDQEGAVMLVVMLILLVATAAAGFAVSNIQSEVHAAGNERLALQTRYVAEAAIMTTITWIDLLGSTGQWEATKEAWKTGGPPEMSVVAEPDIKADVATGLLSHAASRSTMLQQDDLVTDASEVSPLSVAMPPATAGTGGTGGTGGGGGGTGGGGGAPPSNDVLGSFGPRQAYELPAEGYVVDITDCYEAASAGVPGAPIGGPQSGLKPMRLLCVLTARGRLVLPGTRTRDWNIDFDDGALDEVTYRQPIFGTGHDSRATILSPEFFGE